MSDLTNDPFRSDRGSRGPRQFDWHEDMPVPGELNLACEECGFDLTGLDQRICPGCGRRFHLPVPEELDLHCAECGYNLTGLTSRVCPECGTGFDVSGLRHAQRIAERFRLRNRFPWQDVVTLGVAAVLTLFGAGMVLIKMPMLALFCIVVVGIAFARGYNAGMEFPRILLLAGVSLAIIGLLLVVLF